MKKLFKYIENIWLGKDGKPSIRRVLALAFSIDLIINVHKCVDILYKIGAASLIASKLPSDVIMALSGGLGSIYAIIAIEAGMVVALLSLTTYQNTKDQSQDN